MATLQGVYTASVLDNRAPEGLARVLVRVSGVDDASATRGAWARVATMMAGPNRGTFFLPEVGDEVLVAFENGEVRAPYVIGGLWNAKARPPATSGDASVVKMIRSRSGVVFRIRDDKNNSLVIETPAGSASHCRMTQVRSGSKISYELSADATCGGRNQMGAPSGSRVSGEHARQSGDGRHRTERRTLAAVLADPRP